MGDIKENISNNIVYYRKKNWAYSKSACRKVRR